MPFTAAHVTRAVDNLSRTLDKFDAQEAGAEEVVAAVVVYEEELLATPEE